MQLYVKTCFQACLELHKLVNEQNLSVFINCGAGVSRSSTLFLAFIALFGLYHTEWEKESDGLFSPESILNKDTKVLVDDLLHYLRCYHQLAMPNLKVVHLVIEENKALVEDMRRRLAEEEARRRKEQEEKDRLAALKK